MRQAAPEVRPQLVIRRHSFSSFRPHLFGEAARQVWRPLMACLSVLTVLACGNGRTDFVLPPVAPSILQQPANQTVTVGETATFTVAARGTAPMRYQWSKGGTAISGATASSYTTPATVMADSGGLFSVTITNSKGSVTSSAATLTVNSTTPLATSLVPSSATPPYNGTVHLVPTFSGGTATIGSSGAGSSDISDAAVSGGSYATPALTSATTYTLTVTSPGGDVASATALVTPTSVTISAISPADQTIAPRDQAFSATASGGLTNNLAWTASGGTFAGNVWTPPTTPGIYAIMAFSVDNPSVSVSTNATVSAPVITAQPVSQNVCSNAGATLTVAADYADSYQWKLNGTAIPGATSVTYNIASAVSEDAGNYTVAVTNGAGTANSSLARVVVGSSITSNPTDLSIFATQTATFSVSAQGQGPFTYQWYEILEPLQRSNGAMTGIAIPGATASTYTTPPVDANADQAQFYATVTDACGGSPMTSSSALLTVNTGNVPPTITTEPAGQVVTAGDTTSFTVQASGTAPLTYQWYRVPAGSVAGTAILGANAATYDVPSGSTASSNDQDGYYVMVSNDYGQAVSQRAQLAVGSGILIQITGQPQTVYVNEGAPATLQVTATSVLTLAYQWYRADPGSSTFTAIAGATGATYTVNPTSSADSGAVYKVEVSNGVTSTVTSNSAALFVGTLDGIRDLCDDNWQALGDAVALGSCDFQLTAADFGQYGEIVWPTLVSTGSISLSFTVTISDPSFVPADGFAMVLGDPSLGATSSTTGGMGQGLGARGIPGFVLGFDTYFNIGDPNVPYLGVGRGETDLWENPWFNVNTNIPALATFGSSVSHDYVITIVQGQMTVTMDGAQVFSGKVEVPPVAYLYITASTGGSWEETVVSNLSATVSAPSN